MTHNLDELSFDSWIKFVFDHSVEKNDDKEWYWQKEWELEFKNSALQITYLSRFFENPEFLKNEYSWEQIEQGFWFLTGKIVTDIHVVEYPTDLSIDVLLANPAYSMVNLLHDKRVPFSLRKNCIRLMENLYTKLFVEDPIKVASFMWWDQICYDYFMNAAVTKTEDGLKIQDVMFQTLSNILKSTSIFFQICSLHGLGHLRHKDTEQLIREYLGGNEKLPSAIKDYAEGCVLGTMDRIHIPYEFFQHKLSLS